MPVEGLIYLYLAVCAGLIGFNLTAAARAKHRERRIARKADRMERRILRQLPLLEAAGLVEEGFLRGMERRLRRVESMLALDAALERLQARQPEQVWALLRAMDGVTVALAKDYCRRRTMWRRPFFPISSENTACCRAGGTGRWKGCCWSFCDSRAFIAGKAPCRPSIRRETRRWWCRR